MPPTVNDYEGPAYRAPKEFMARLAGHACTLYQRSKDCAVSLLNPNSELLVKVHGWISEKIERESQRIQE